MAKKKVRDQMSTTDADEKISQARLLLPARDMERARKAARSIGLGMSAFIRQAVLEKMVDVERRMGP